MKILKKSIFIAIFLFFILFSPTYAQTVPTVQEQYQQTLIQLITLLQEQVKVLMNQLISMQKSQAVLNTQTFAPSVPVQNTSNPTMVGSVSQPSVAVVPFKVNQFYFREDGKVLLLSSSVEIDVNKLKFIKPEINTVFNVTNLSESICTNGPIGTITSSDPTIKLCYDYSNQIPLPISVIDGVEPLTQAGLINEGLGSVGGFVYKVILSDSPFAYQDIAGNQEKFGMFKVILTSKDGRISTSTSQQYTTSSRDLSLNASMGTPVFLVK